MIAILTFILPLFFFKNIKSEVKICPLSRNQSLEEACGYNSYPVMVTAYNINEYRDVLKKCNVPSAAVAGWNGQYIKLVLTQNGSLTPYDPNTNPTNYVLCEYTGAGCHTSVKKYTNNRCIEPDHCVKPPVCKPCEPLPPCKPLPPCNPLPLFPVMPPHHNRPIKESLSDCFTQKSPASSLLLLLCLLLNNTDLLNDSDLQAVKICFNNIINSMVFIKSKAFSMR